MTSMTKRNSVYAVEVSDQIMIAHSFRGELFGPAQNVHGATFVIRVAFLADELGAPTGGYTYDRRIVAELPALGWRPEVVNLGDGFPCPTAETRARACARLSVLAHGRPLVIDGLAFGALPDAAHGLRPRHPL